MGKKYYHPVILVLCVALVLKACTSTFAPTTHLWPVKESRVMVLSKNNLAAGGYAQRNSVLSTSLRQSKSPDTQEAIFVALVAPYNRSVLPIKFGPDDVFLADSGLRLLPRISEEWLEDFYKNILQGLKAKASYRPPIPVFAPQYRLNVTQMRIGNMTYTTTRIGPDPYAAMGQGIGILLATAISEAKRAHARMEIKEIQKQRQSVLEGLLRPTVLLPKIQINQSVYFYNPPTTKVRFPLKLIVKIGKEFYLIHFNPRP